MITDTMKQNICIVESDTDGRCMVRCICHNERVQIVGCSISLLFFVFGWKWEVTLVFILFTVKNKKSVVIGPLIVVDVIWWFDRASPPNSFHITAQNCAVVWGRLMLRSPEERQHLLHWLSTTIFMWLTSVGVTDTRALLVTYCTALYY